MSSYYGSDDPHSRSAFVPKPDLSDPVDPFADEANHFIAAPEPTAMRPMEERSSRANDNLVWDETDNPFSMSAFVHEADSQRAPPQPSDLAQEDDQTNSESPIDDDIGSLTVEPTTKQLILLNALTLPQTTTIYEASWQMAAARTCVVVLTDSNALVSGILTYKDIVIRAIAPELDLVNTAVSVVMTKNPITVSADTLAIETMLKLIKEHVNQFPVLENGEVIGLVMLEDYFIKVVMGRAAADGYNLEEACRVALNLRSRKQTNKI